MAVKTMERERIIMNFSVAPSAEDIEVMALSALESLPEQLMELCEGLAVKVEVTLNTHDAGGVTELDLKMAAKMNAYAGK